MHGLTVVSSLRGCCVCKHVLYIDVQTALLNDATYKSEWLQLR